MKDNLIPKLRKVEERIFRYTWLVSLITELVLFTFFTLICVASARISVMYAHDKLSDMIAEQCLSEMYPKNKRIEIQESDEPCIIFCVLKKFGIMSATGVINLEVYRYVWKL